VQLFRQIITFVQAVPDRKVMSLLAVLSPGIDGAHFPIYYLNGTDVYCVSYSLRVGVCLLFSTHGWGIRLDLKAVSIQ
jgi:hypothetical protein